MNIVQVPRRFTRSHWGGTETYILEICKRLREAGHGTEILCPNALAASDREILDEVPVRRVPYFYPYLGLDAEARQQLDLSGGSLFSFHLLRELWSWPGLDLIHLHTGRRPGAIGRYVAMKRGIPYVVSVHGGVFDVPEVQAAAQRDVTRGAFEWGKVLGWWVGARRVMDDAAAVICVGRREYDETRARYPGKRVVYMPNAVDAHRFRHGDGRAFRARHCIPERARVVLSVGRIDPQKDQKLLVSLLPRLRAVEPEVHLVLVGHVTHEAYARELAAMAQGLPVTIIPGLSGQGQELVDAYHAADCFVLASVHEPFGIVILEAWAAGLPVVASRTGGIPGFVEHGHDGLLCEPRDGAAFIAALEKVLGNPVRAAGLAQRGREKASRDYSWEPLTARLISLYEEVALENLVRK
jgi:glycosyltransferase involved in cell wall biosynthesis